MPQAVMQIRIRVSRQSGRSGENSGRVGETRELDTERSAALLAHLPTQAKRQGAVMAARSSLRVQVGSSGAGVPDGLRCMALHRFLAM
jgi:hypothetical protein